VSGDPLPSDKSGPVRAPSVPSQGPTTRARPPTGAVEPVRSPEATGRIKTQWTGNLNVPLVSAEEPVRNKKKSAVPLILGVIAVAGIGAVIAVVALKKTPPAAPAPQPEQGSAVIATPQPPPPQPQPPQPQPPPEPALPDMVQIHFESTPKGADVIDVATNNKLGKTPYTFTVAGSKTPRQFKFRLAHYGDATVELVPNKAEIHYSQPLVRGSTKPGSTVTKLPDTDGTPVTNPDAIKTPDTGKVPNVTVKQPDDTPQLKGSATEVKQPDTTKPPADDCPGDEPCLKTNIPGMGSAK
jgi:hypothetical protein